MKIILLFSFSFLFSCTKQKENNSTNFETYSVTTDTIQLQKNILEKGDIESFTNLMRFYENPQDTLTFKILKYSYVMADQYNYNRANYFIARSIIRREIRTNNYRMIKNLDKKNKIEVLKRLNKCSNQNSIICTELLVEYYKGINNILEVEKYEKKLKLLVD